MHIHLTQENKSNVCQKYMAQGKAFAKKIDVIFFAVCKRIKLK